MTPRHLNFIFLISLILSFICAGCVSKSTAPPKYPEIPDAVFEKGDKVAPSGYYIHTVTLPNESISIIAKWFTGDLRKWEVLAKFNPTINPNRIFLGDKIKIPRNLMTRHTPMTLEFVEESQPKPRRRPTVSSSPAKAKPAQTETESPAVQSKPEPDPEPVAEEEPFLFGPKGYSK